MSAPPQAIVDLDEANRMLGMFPLKYPENIALPVPMPTPTPEDVRIFRVTPTVISVLAYSKGFGHTELFTC